MNKCQFLFPTQAIHHRYGRAQRLMHFSYANNLYRICVCCLFVVAVVPTRSLVFPPFPVCVCVRAAFSFGFRSA